MTRRALLGFLAINIVVSIAVVLLIIFVWSESSEENPTVITRPPIIITAPNESGDNSVGAIPNQAYEQTITALNTKATADAREIQTLADIAGTAGFSIETEVPITELPVGSSSVPPLSSDILDSITLPPSSGGASSNGTSGVGTATPNDGCQRYFVQSGDTCGIIADNFNVSLDELINLNELDDSCLLNVDQELKIPGAACQPPPTITPTPTITSTPFSFGTLSITNTPVPTSTTADVQIVQVLQAGDVTGEQVEIRNTGVDVVELDGWTLTDSGDNTFTFPDLRMQPSQVVRVFSRVGQNTPAALYWNQTEAIWETGETVTLLDGSDTPQSVLIVGESQTIDFGEDDN